MADKQNRYFRLVPISRVENNRQHSQTAPRFETTGRFADDVLNRQGQHGDIVSKWVAAVGVARSGNYLCIANLHC